MGNEAPKQEKDLKVDDELSNMIKELIEEKGQYTKKNPKPKKKNNIINNESDNNIDNNTDYNIENADEMETELDFKTITDFIDLIYTKNINMQLKHRGNRSAYEAVFDIRNVMGNKEDLNNNDYNKKSMEIMNNLIEPKIDDYSSVQTYIKSDKDNIDDYYIQNDFFRKWDYEDDIFKIDFNDVNYEEEEKEDEKKDKKEKNKIESGFEEIPLNSNNKNDNLQDISNSNISEIIIKPFSRIYSKKKNISYKFNNKKNKNNHLPIETSNKEENVINLAKNLNKKKNAKINESIIENNKDKYNTDSDSDSSKNIKVGNTTKKEIYEDSSSDESEKIKRNKKNNNKNNHLINNSIHKLIQKNENNTSILYRKNTPDSYIHNNIKVKRDAYDKNQQLYNNKYSYYNKYNDNIYNHPRDNIIKNKKIIYDNNNINEYNDLSYDNRYPNYNNLNYYNNNNDYNEFFINNIPKINKNEDSDEYNIHEDYIRDNNYHRTKTPITSRIRNNNKIDKKEMIDRGTSTDQYEKEIKKYNKLLPDKTSNIYYQHHISKTPDKELRNQPQSKKEPRNLVPKNNVKQRIDIRELDNVYETIKKLDYQLNLIEKDKRQKNLNNKMNNYNKNIGVDNILSKRMVNNKNKIYKNKRAVTPISINNMIDLTKYRNKPTKNVSAQKTFDKSNMKGYKDIVIEKIEHKKIDKESNRQNYKYAYGEMNKPKTPNIQSRRKAPKKNTFIVSNKTNVNNIRINKHKYSRENEPVNIVNYVSLPTGQSDKRPPWK